MAQEAQVLRTQSHIRYGITVENDVLVEFSSPVQLNQMTLDQAKAMVGQLQECIKMAEERIASKVN